MYRANHHVHRLKGQCDKEHILRVGDYYGGKVEKLPGDMNLFKNGVRMHKTDAKACHVCFPHSRHFNAGGKLFKKWRYTGDIRHFA
jgi:hypothetical protein